MIEHGVVARVKDNIATVRIARQGKCDKCHICSVAKDGMSVEIIVKNTLGVNVGDEVDVDMGKRSLHIARAIAYIVSLALVGVAIGIGSIFGKATQVWLSICTFVISFLSAVLVDKLVISKKLQFKPHLVQCKTNDEMTKQNDSVGE